MATINATQQAEETIIPAGLYDASNNLIASWDTLVNTYGMNVEKDYTSSNYKTDTQCPYCVLTNNSELANGKKLIIDDSVKRIGNYAFQPCSSLTSISIPDGVTSIGEFAFYGCNNLTSINIGNDITNIGSMAFGDCTSLTDIYYDGTKEDWSKISIISNNSDALLNATIHYSNPERENITITFNGTTYSIPTTALEPASTALKAHLTSDMAGSGATIKLGGVSYNIDATKLATARDEFVTHLGTIAGTGTKVKVNGVEYGIDTAKIADAVAELHEVLGGMMSGGGDDYNHNAPELHPKGIIPEGATYTVAATGEVLVAGDAFPTSVGSRDGYTFGDYRYTYTINGWNVNIMTDKTKTRYGAILESINGELVTNIESTFYDCPSLVSAPVIPNGVTNMESTFSGCSSLVNAPIIPDGVTNMEDTFDACSSLVTAPVIPDGVTSLSYTFYECASLVTAPVIPDGVTNMEWTFYNCTSLSGSITINATPAAFEWCLLNTKITEILGDCQNKEAILATREI